MRPAAGGPSSARGRRPRPTTSTRPSTRTAHFPGATTSLHWKPPHPKSRVTTRRSSTPHGSASTRQPRTWTRSTRSDSWSKRTGGTTHRSRGNGCSSSTRWPPTSSPPATPTPGDRQYVSGRLGTDLADHPTFRPGYAPAGWTNLTDHLRRLGVSDEEILAAGLGRVASTGRIIDQFRDRLVLPIRNGDQIHGFIGRRNPTAADDRKAGPKYLNTPATDLFDKSAQLFGLSEGRAALDAGATPVLVEGFFDAIAVTLAGDGQYVGVAPLGTSFTQAQANQLRPYIGPERPGVTVATDADLAGQVAAQRAFWMLTARGDTPRHVAMRGGQDPAEVLEHAGPTALRACLDDAQPLARHLLDERLNHLGDTPQSVLDCAAVIAAQPPHTWMEQIDYVTARTNPGPGVVQQAVADAARRWTLDPLGEAQGQISNLATVRARLQRAAQAPLSDDGQADLVSTAAAAATRRLHSGQSGEPNSNGATTAAGTTTQELPPLEVWRQLAHSIDSRLTAGEDWPMLCPGDPGSRRCRLRRGS